MKTLDKILKVGISAFVSLMIAGGFFEAGYYVSRADPHIVDVRGIKEIVVDGQKGFVYLGFDKMADTGKINYSTRNVIGGLTNDTIYTIYDGWKKINLEKKR